MRIGNHRVTAAEVARRAGVSQPTVSLVLSRNPKARVAPETRKRVLTIAAELGYRPNLLAQGLVSRRSYAIGVVVPGFDNPAYASIVSGAEKVAAAEGYAVLLCETHEAEAVRRHIDELRDRQIDGVIVAGIAVSTLAEQTLDALNIVLINQPSDRFVTVGDDSLRAGLLAAEHFTGLGHRRVAFVGPSDSTPAFRLRERGFVQGLRTAGVPVVSELVRRADATVAGGIAGMRALLAQAHPPTAVFCANDLAALGAHKACVAAGLSIPRELSLLGCDDIEMSTLVTPELSTIAVPQRELGARAMRLLLRQITEPGKLPPSAQLLPVKLVLRGTTAPLTTAQEISA